MGAGTHGVLRRGLAALATNPPSGGAGAPAAEFPGIGAAEPSERVRKAEPGRAEEVVAAVTEWHSANTRTAGPRRTAPHR
ncbi:hypothetical protein CQJ94_24350 [Glycomyces fuscus]|nr:hypothetical protein CQJ94_24350 [Glycomyces fuscus]